MIKQSNNSIAYTAIFAVLINFIIGCGGDEDPQTLRANYLPIEVGNSWIFVDPGDPEDSGIISITGTTKLSNGKTVFIAKADKNDKGYLSRAANDLLLFHQTLSDLQGELIYSPPIKVGTTWRGQEGEAEVVAQETVNTPAGIFQNCFRIDVRDVYVRVRGLSSYDYYSVWLAKDVGPVKLAGIDRDGEIRSTVVLDKFGKNLDFPEYIDTESEGQAPDAAFESATPASGSELAANANIALKFSSDPGAVEVSAGTVTGSGKNRTVNGPFDVGTLTLTVTWANGGADGTSLTYTVVAVDETAPKLVSSSPENGAKNQDPEKIFADGIVLTFDEAVSPGSEAVMLTSDGNDLGWEVTYDGTKVTLKGLAGQDLSNEAEYEVKGKVRDGFGNEAEVSVVFTTRLKE